MSESLPLSRTNSLGIHDNVRGSRAQKPLGASRQLLSQRPQLRMLLRHICSCFLPSLVPLVWRPLVAFKYMAAKLPLKE